MTTSENLVDYLSHQRWCNFKEELRRHEISDIKLETLAFDHNKKLLVIGKTLSRQNRSSRYFMMPLAEADNSASDTLTLNGKKYTDALQKEDYWQKMMELFTASDNTITFANGWQLRYKNIGLPEVVEELRSSPSRPLGVEQSNTTLAVGDDKIAFKLERMLDFSNEINPEFEMNEKLMRENCPVMPKTYGYLILRNNKNQQASSGIIQEFIKNQGDLWNYSLGYIKEQLNAGYLQQRPLLAEEHPYFMDLIKNLSVKTAQMSECLSRADSNPRFTPENVDQTFLRTYEKQMEVLLFQTRRSITENLEKLPEPSHTKAAFLLDNWDNLSQSYVSKNITQLQSSKNKGYTVRVHGDFHLGQVMVTKDNDLRFIDFAGEPDLPLEQRKQKHIYVRDIAGMYRSIKGYLGAVAVEEFAAEASDETAVQSRKQYARAAVKPLIDAAAQTFLGDYKLTEPWMSLEVLRKNLYEVNYEVNNRPQMAYVAIDGLSDLLQSSSERQISKEKSTDLRK